MKTKTINSILAKVTDEWIDSIDDENVRKLALRNTIITGGCITSMLQGEKVNDYDIYFRNQGTAVAVAEYYVRKFKNNPPTRHKGSNAVANIHVDVDENDRVKIAVKSAGIASEDGAQDYQYFETLSDAQQNKAGEYIEKVMDSDAKKADDLPAYRPVFLSSNAITLSNKIQLVIRFYGEPEEIHKNYDFIHCTNYWTSHEKKTVLSTPALESIITKELRYTGSLYPLCSVIRTRKFIARGWTINAGQYLKMIMQLNALDLTDIETLEDQLIGVDVAYFHELIDKLKNKDAKKVDTAYLVEIIDRMF